MGKFFIKSPIKGLSQIVLTFSKKEKKKWDLKIITWNVCSIQQVFKKSSIDLEHYPFYL